MPPENPHDTRTAGFERATLPMAAVSLDGGLIDVNAALCGLVGREADTLRGQPWSTLADGADLPPGALDAQEGAGEFVQQWSPADDGQPPHAVRVAWTLTRDAGDRAPYLRCVVVDETPQGAATLPATGTFARSADSCDLRAAEQRRRQQEDFFVALAQRSFEVALVADPTGRLVYASHGISRVLGYTSQEVVSFLGWDFVHPDDIPGTAEIFGRVVAGGATETAVLRVRNAAGEWRWIEETMHNCLDTPIRGIVCNLRDITERVRTETELTESAFLYRMITDNIDEGLWLATDEGTTVFVNERMSEILGVPRDALAGRPLESVLDPGLLQRVKERLLQRGERGPERYELPYHHPDGSRRTLSVVAAPLDSVSEGRRGSLAMVSDITRTRQLEHDLRRAALYDPLVDLPNRALLMDRLTHALRRETRSTAVLFVDVDQFKLVNDARGHSEGDEVLVQVAARLRTSARASDTVARLGGDEFVVVCEDTDDDTAAEVADALRHALEVPLTVPSGEITVTAAIGIAVSPAVSAEALVRDADIAMYSAKVAGRARIRHYDAELAARTQERRELSTELEIALGCDALTMHYQPVVDLRDGQVVGMESLARWKRPDGLHVSPERFVPIAEETGLAHQLDRWALRTALDGATRLRSTGAAHPGSFVSVNLSARNLGNPALEEFLVAWTEGSVLAPHDVLLEITESAIMSDAEAAVAVLQRLRDVGFLIAADDFGTGHSSLAYLRNLPLTTLKIDRSFVTAIGEDRNSLAIASSIIDLATAMGLSIIAEGVETLHHAELLLDLGCHWAQGWLWSPAVSLDEARLRGTMLRTYETGGSPLWCEDEHVRGYPN